MQLRTFIAYLIMLLIFTGLGAAYLYATREARAMRKAHQRADRMRRERRAKEAELSP